MRRTPRWRASEDRQSRVGRKEESKAESVKGFQSLVASLESSKNKLVKLLKEKQKATELQAEEVLRQLQLEVHEFCLVPTGSMGNVLAAVAQGSCAPRGWGPNPWWRSSPRAPGTLHV